MNAQSPGSPNRDNFGTPLWESQEKRHLDASVMESCRKYYMGEGGGFPRVQAVVSQVSPRLHVACSNIESVQNEL